MKVKVTLEIKADVPYTVEESDLVDDILSTWCEGDSQIDISNLYLYVRKVEWEDQA